MAIGCVDGEAGRMEGVATALGGVGSWVEDVGRFEWRLRDAVMAC